VSRPVTRSHSKPNQGINSGILPNQETVFGFLNIDKPAGCTSRSAVNAVQKLVRPSRVGHAGTLDPLATGVLVLGIGPATRLVKYVQSMPKTYVADFRLGFESDTEDVLGEVVGVAEAQHVSASQLAEVLPEFVGKIVQIPPKFSALKVNGERAYKLARKGKEVKLDPRPIEIYKLYLNKFEYPDFQLRILCGSGTYVRSLGRDLGRRLGSGAIMTGLERTAIGEFDVASGIAPNDLTLELIKSHLILPQAGLPSMPRIEVPDGQAEKFANGHTWSTSARLPTDEVLAIDQSGRLLTILRQRSPGLFTPAVNFSNYWLEDASAIEPQ
jgi:tRNA pseudouridine55 synthase